MRVKHIGAAVLATAALCACAGGGDPYAAYAEAKKRDGLFRTEIVPADAPFSNEDLAQNFEKIAFFSEFARKNGRVVQAKTEGRLQRWNKPVRYRLEGAGLTEADRAEYAALSRRISELTGLDIGETGGAGDITIRILDARERAEFARDIRRRRLDDRMALAMYWAQTDNLPCVGQTGVATTENYEITTAHILIKNELQGDFRRLCIHEEFAQVMGLLNDDRSVRPSIFNDDQEFVLLTEHDEFLLRILYDPTLTPNMTAEEARPLVPEIVAKLRPGT